jgi:hypothetical protein
MKNDTIFNLHNLCASYELHPKVEEGIDSAIQEIQRLEDIIEGLLQKKEKNTNGSKYKVDWSRV